MNRNDGRAVEDIRPVKIVPQYTHVPPGSALIRMGHTAVLCTASIQFNVPQWMKGQGKGWLTAEYELLPGSTNPRTNRERSMGRTSGRTMEIQRLISRSLRAVMDLKQIPDKTFWIDCEVIQADGGTRTAAITGAYVALRLAVDHLIGEGVLRSNPINGQVAAVSAGIFEGNCMVDLDYHEDSNAQVDLNLVMTAEEEIVEIQGTGETRGYTESELHEMTRLAKGGIIELFDHQRAVLGG